MADVAGDTEFTGMIFKKISLNIVDKLPAYSLNYSPFWICNFLCDSFGRLNSTVSVRIAEQMIKRAIILTRLDTSWPTALKVCEILYPLVRVFAAQNLSFLHFFISLVQQNW